MRALALELGGEEAIGAIELFLILPVGGRL